MKRKVEEKIITEPKKQKEETPESLKASIDYNKSKIKKLENALVVITENCTDPKNLYYQSDVALIKAEITICNSNIFLIKEKLKKFEKQESQPGQ